MPDDGFASETIEYLALCDAISHSNKKQFCAMEFGAGWGPWISLAGVIARSCKIKDISLIGMEASLERTALMKAHLSSNNLRQQTDKEKMQIVTEIGTKIKVRLINGAIESEDGYINNVKEQLQGIEYLGIYNY